MSYVDPDLRQFLDSLQVGDLVAVYRSRSWRAHTVERVTAGRVFVGNTEFNRRTGDEWGGGGSYYRDYLRPLTPERIAEAHQEILDAKEAARRQELMRKINPGLGKASISVLEKILEVLKEEVPQ
jgi:hypothetical protein